MKDVLKVLGNEWAACEARIDERTMQTVVSQFRARHPKWWVVDGSVVIPMWIVEKLRTVQIC